MGESVELWSEPQPVTRESVAAYLVGMFNTWEEMIASDARLVGLKAMATGTRYRRVAEMPAPGEPERRWRAYQ